MITAWSHLPNAKHIDRILSHFKSHTADWDAARDENMDESRSAAWRVAKHVVEGVNIDAIWWAAHSALYDVTIRLGRAMTLTENWNPVWYHARHAAWCTILALIAWDESAEYLNLSSKQVRIMALLGDNKAILLLPAVLVFEKSKELV